MSHTPVKVDVPRPRLQSMTELTENIHNLQKTVKALELRVIELEAQSVPKEEAIA